MADKYFASSVLSGGQKYEQLKICRKFLPFNNQPQCHRATADAKTNWKRSFGRRSFLMKVNAAVRPVGSLHLIKYAHGYYTLIMSLKMIKTPI